MLRRTAIPLLFILFSCLPLLRATAAQPASSSLGSGSMVERTIRLGETHSFSVRLEPDQFLQFVIDQRGIDVVVRLYSPGGERLGEYDSPNGTDGPEGVSLVADAAGVYRIAVSPLEQEENTPSGRYEIRVLDLRPATKQ